MESRLSSRVEGDYGGLESHVRKHLCNEAIRVHSMAGKDNRAQHVRNNCSKSIKVEMNKIRVETTNVVESNLGLNHVDDMNLVSSGNQLIVNVP